MKKILHIFKKNSFLHLLVTKPRKLHFFQLQPCLHRKLFPQILNVVDNKKVIIPFVAEGFKLSLDSLDELSSDHLKSSSIIVEYFFWNNSPITEKRKKK